VNSVSGYSDNYGSSPTRQSVGDALYDNQLKTLALPLSELVAGYPRGTILDIGCGDGVLLKKLSQIPAFKDKKAWIYLGSDYDEQVQGILHLATDLRLHRRVEGWNLEDFYSKTLHPNETPRPFICVIRNLFHELDIQQTAKLISRLVSILEPSDFLYVQDLLVLPQAERGNACWVAERFRAVLDRVGFVSNFVEEPTKNGNRWFTCSAKKHRSDDKISKNPMGEDEVLEVVFGERKLQYQEWMQVESPPPDLRDAAVSTLDFDLQRFGLHLQLYKMDKSGQIMPLGAQEQRKLLSDTFVKGFEGLSRENAAVALLEEPKHFRDRAHDQDWLEAFLLGGETVAVLRGGPYIGKTYLAVKVLANRAHHKQAVLIDIPENPTVWNLVEQYSSGIGAQLQSTLLSSLREISFGDIASPFTSAVKLRAASTIVVFDHFERLLDPKERVSDPAIEQFLSIICSEDGAKVLFCSRFAPHIEFIPSERSAGLREIGRFPNDEHVENLLDDFIDRSLLQIDSYPPTLLSAIDRHPYMAVLAAQIIQREGKTALDDQGLIRLVRSKLRAALLMKLVDASSQLAVNVLSLLRIPVPRNMLSDLAGEDSVRHAEAAGILYHAYDPHYSGLVRCIGALRRSTIDFDGFESEHSLESRVGAEFALHRAITNAYAVLYRSTEDPRWLREMHFHTLATGEVTAIAQFGSVYASEVFWAGEYWFRSLKKYKEALWAFKAVEELGMSTSHTQMRTAACMMRVGRENDGESKYATLISAFPQWEGVKSSYIDSLLYIGRYSKAYEKLVEYGRSMSDTFAARQFGRAFFGMHMYAEAVRAFENELNDNQEIPVYESLAMSYHRLGDSRNVERILKAGMKRHPSSRRLQLRYAGHLMRNGTPQDIEEANETLKGLATLFPTDGRVLQQYCKCLCRTNRVDMAEEIWRERREKIRPEQYRLPIHVEILIGKNAWDSALRELSNVDPADEHLVGLKKKVFLSWARSVSEGRTAIAGRGLSVPMDLALERNMPLMVTNARLAALAADSEAFAALVEKIRVTNSGIADMLLSEDSALGYWEDDPFS